MAPALGILQPTHLMVDGEMERAATGSDVLAFLADAPGEAHMTAINFPTVIIPPGSPDTIIGFQLIAESHISVHCIGLQAFVEIFSCKPFKPMPLVRFIRQRFHLARFNWHVQERLVPATAQ